MFVDFQPPRVQIGIGEWKVAPKRDYQEMPGLRRLLSMNNTNTERVFDLHGGGVPELTDILKWVIDKYREDPKKITELVQKIDNKTDFDMLSQIKIIDVDPNKGYPAQQSIQHAINQITDPQARRDAQSLISNTILGMQEQVAHDPQNAVDIGDIIDHSVSNSQQRAVAVANALGFDMSWLAENPNFDLMVDYMHTLTQRISKFEQFGHFEAQYYFGPAEQVHHIRETKMLKDLRRQAGVDCVFNAVHNVVRAANENGAKHVKKTTLEEIQRIIPRDPLNGEGNIGRFVNLMGFQEKLGFNTATGDFDFMTMVKILESKKGAVIARLGRGHEVAVLGVRQNPQNKLLEFWVADSLNGGTKPGDVIQPYWKNGRALITEAYMQEDQAHTMTEVEMILVTWS